MNASLSLLLQTVTLVLLGMQRNPQASPAMVQDAIFTADQAVQLATQAVAPIPFVTPSPKSKWTNITDLRAAAYLNSAGKYELLGKNVDLIESDTSFGNLNNGPTDGAAAIVQQADGAGHTHFALAAFLNQNHTLFNIANITLGTNVQILSHHIIDKGIISLDAVIDGTARSTYQYQLVGNQLMKI